MEHIENHQSVDGGEHAIGQPFWGEREGDNAKNSFISGFFQTLGAGAATGLLALLGVFVHTLLSANGKDQSGSSRQD
jgi:hypothetical protein